MIISGACQDAINKAATPYSVIVFPIKSYSERVPRKNFTLINGVPLYQILPMTCLKSGLFDKVVIDTDSDEIKKWCEGRAFEVIDRLDRLAHNDANGNDLLRYHRNFFPKAELIWQGFVTTPFIKPETILNMYWTLVNGYHNGICDSVMTASIIKGFLWGGTQGRLRPLAHRPDVMPRSQDLEPVYMERHGIFGITGKAFDITKTRAGMKLLAFPLDKEEDQDIDYPEDLAAAQAKAKFHKVLDYSSDEVIANSIGCL